MDDDASPEVLGTMEAAANIHVDDTITPDGGKLMVGQGYPPIWSLESQSLRIGLPPMSQRGGMTLEICRQT